MNLRFPWLGHVLPASRSQAAIELPELRYPLPGTPRVGVLGLTVRQEPGIRVFPEWSSRTLDSGRLQALAGWRRDLDVVVRLRQCGRLMLAELSLPLVVFSTPDDGPLTEDHHDMLWKHFQLPVFEQIRRPDGSLVAVECEARLGFHAILPPALAAYEDVCPCGAAPRWSLTECGVRSAAAGD